MSIKLLNMAKYRLYIDESGTHNYTSSQDIGKKYLSLTGVILSDAVNVDDLQPALDRAKRLLTDDPDDLPTLHREEIISGVGVFKKLSDPPVREAFNRLMIGLFANLDYTICCVVLDKGSHLARYGQAAHHPYHYCLSILLERYTDFLGRNSSSGDVMAESRGKQEDRLLQGEYTRFHTFGTSFRSSNFVQSTLTSKNIKIKPKGVAGLEFADLLTLATKLDVLATEGAIGSLSKTNYLWQVVRTIQPKYYKVNGRIKGFGRKLVK